MFPQSRYGACWPGRAEVPSDVPALGNGNVEKISLLGSTGSIGTQTLDIAEENPDKFEIVALSAGKNLDVLAEQIKKFKPKMVSISDGADVAKLREMIADMDGPAPELLYGEDGMDATYVESQKIDTLRHNKEKFRDTFHLDPDEPGFKDQKPADAEAETEDTESEVVAVAAADEDDDIPEVAAAKAATLEKVKALRLKLEETIKRNEDADELERIPREDLLIDEKFRDELIAEGDTRVAAAKEVLATHAMHQTRLNCNIWRIIMVVSVVEYHWWKINAGLR